MTEQAKRSASEGQSFFGLTPERLQPIVDEAGRRFEQARSFGAGNAGFGLRYQRLRRLSALQWPLRNS